MPTVYVVNSNSPILFYILLHQLHRDNGKISEIALNSTRIYYRVTGLLICWNVGLAFDRATMRAILTDLESSVCVQENVRARKTSVFKSFLRQIYDAVQKLWYLGNAFSVMSSTHLSKNGCKLLLSWISRGIDDPFQGDRHMLKHNVEPITIREHV